MLKILVGKDTVTAFNCHLQSNMLNEKDIAEYQQFMANPTDSTHYKVSKQVLKSLLNSSVKRAEQARIIADLAHEQNTRFLIVCGDFNDTPLSYAHRQFGRFMNDAFSKTGAGLGITYHEHNLYYRIDHIFCSHNIKLLQTYVDRVQNDSDHYPVISRIRLR